MGESWFELHRRDEVCEGALLNDNAFRTARRARCEDDVWRDHRVQGSRRARSWAAKRVVLLDLLGTPAERDSACDPPTRVRSTREVPPNLPESSRCARWDSRDPTECNPNRRAKLRACCSRVPPSDRGKRRRAHCAPAPTRAGSEPIGLRVRLPLAVVVFAARVDDRRMLGVPSRDGGDAGRNWDVRLEWKVWTVSAQ